VIWRYLIEGSWIVFIVYWVATALKTRRTVSQESSASRYGVLFLEVLGFILLFSETVQVGVLGRRIFPRSDVLAVSRVALTWIGIAIALWARWHLGQYWRQYNSQRGPQNHPHRPLRLLSSPDLFRTRSGGMGGVLAVDRWGCVAGFVLIVLGYWIKASKEESMLMQQFGQAFQEHRRHTGFLLPKL
jgi:protein-S-isoprenylcysteine O-methyltransferase Ste14